MMGETSRATRYAIFEDGGKQYRAEEGALIRVDRRDTEPGAEITFDKVLLVGGEGAGEGTKVGTPAVSGASVVAVVEAEEKGPKVYGLKRRNHGRSKTRWGHRQKYTLVRVAKIVEG
ncbi:MAG: 50S ribosomal protein L21 [Planctomycetota bacterium]|jgi:large subunit ribosomal protein L21